MENACVIRLGTQPQGQDFGSNRVQGQRLIDRLLRFNMNLRWPLMLAVFHEKKFMSSTKFFCHKGKYRFMQFTDAEDEACM